MQIINSIIRCTHESHCELCESARTTRGVVIIQLTMGHAACVALVVVAFAADKDKKCFFWESRAKSRFDMVADMEVKPLLLLLLLLASGIIT